MKQQVELDIALAERYLDHAKSTNKNADNSNHLNDTEREEEYSRAQNLVLISIAQSLIALTKK